MEKIVFKKENGKVSIINADPALLYYIESTATNPCINCEKGYVSRCQKMADGTKKNISKYDFITDGYQVNSTDGDLLNLVVSKCDNFENDRERVKPKTKEQIAALNYLKESIKVLYFESENFDEANQIQRDLINRGQLSNVEDPVANREFIKNLVR